jgi:hypothetical protein
MFKIKLVDFALIGLNFVVKISGSEVVIYKDSK